MCNELVCVVGIPSEICWLVDVCWSEYYSVHHPVNSVCTRPVSSEIVASMYIYPLQCLSPDSTVQHCLLPSCQGWVCHGKNYFCQDSGKTSKTWKMAKIERIKGVQNTKSSLVNTIRVAHLNPKHFVKYTITLSRLNIWIVQCRRVFCIQWCIAMVCVYLLCNGRMFSFPTSSYKNLSGLGLCRGKKCFCQSVSTTEKTFSTYWQKLTNPASCTEAPASIFVTICACRYTIMQQPMMYKD